MTSMKAPMSQATPMLGSTLVIGVSRTPASAANPAPIMNVVSLTRPVSMPSPRARVSFMITARAERPRRVPWSVSANAAPITRAATKVNKR